MDDKEKVIKGLMSCDYSNSLHETCFQCPYLEINKEKGLAVCTACLAHDALALLREQEPVDVIVEPLNDTRYIFCGACRCMLAQGKPKGYKYCPWCGRAVKWDD